MSRLFSRLTVAFATAVLLLPAPLRATDVDGPNDCQRPSQDFGDAPEGVQAYPGVPAMFPTCTAAGPVGVRDATCAPVSTAPGPAGFVRHLNPTGVPAYWFGCGAASPMGIDSENDGKTNDNGAAISACTDILVDCVEAAFGMNFGQDDCTGGTDAGLRSPLVFTACSLGVVTFDVTSCAPATRQVYLNVLLDMNEDGDWNDNFLCGTQCAYEWAVRNVVITLPPGCSTLSSPSFLVGPRKANGFGWLRITMSDTPVTGDFPWAGVALVAGQALQGGETEDYPVVIRDPITDPCGSYDDFGDAPEQLTAYPGGVVGNFPTCTFGGPAGARDVTCGPISTVPGAAAGYVKHVASPGDPNLFWLGCAIPGPSVDSEGDGKVNGTGAGASVCATGVTVDCGEAVFGGAMTFGQDECWGDADAGVVGPVTFTACDTTTLRIQAYNCQTQSDVQGYLNVLVDWNADGDWNDNFQCTPGGPCSYEWSVKNQPVVLPPGCSTLTPLVLAGPTAGPAWMRVTITASPVPDDFPWAGSAGLAGGTFRGGETEDYAVTITGEDPCERSFTDFGDAPEEIAAYSTGLPGHFPTCIFPTGPGSQEVDCGAALSTPPGPTGYVRHTTPATAAQKVWLGCGLPGAPGLGVDSEADGKVNFDPPFGLASACNPNTLVDCFEPAWLNFGQDECYGSPDAGLAWPMLFRTCRDTVLEVTAYNCGTDTVLAHVNVLVDWNGDGDWNDVLKCSQLVPCRPEWVAKNVLVRIKPGCDTLRIPVSAGPRAGEGWMRVTLTLGTVGDDFPWNGSLGEPNGMYTSGETEDYPVRIEQSTTGVDPVAPNDLGFAPLIPNPARDGTSARFTLPRDGDASLVVYDVTGRTVRVLARGWRAAGEHLLPWDFRDDSGRTVPAGLYLVKLRVGADELTRRVIRLN